MERFEVPNYDSDSNCLTRWRVVQTPWAGFYVHRFDGPDPRPTLHDHPWPFLSCVLRGGYIERRLTPMAMSVQEDHVVRWFNRKRTHDAHSIVRLLRVPTWTLMFVGRRVRTWGYLEGPEWVFPSDHDPLNDPTPMGAERWRWTEFNKHLHAAEFDAALARRRSS